MLRRQPRCRRLSPAALLLDEPDGGADEAEHGEAGNRHNGGGRAPGYLDVVAGRRAGGV